MTSEIALHPFLTKPGDGQVLVKSGLRLKISSAQTGGAFEVFEVDGQGGPSPHMHHDHDEWFYITKGVFTFTIGAQKEEATEGSMVFIPRGTPHAFKRGEGARGVIMVFPAQLEGFFRELGEGLAAGVSEADLRASLAGKYDSWPVRGA